MRGILLVQILLWGVFY